MKKAEMIQEVLKVAAIQKQVVNEKGMNLVVELQKIDWFSGLLIKNLLTGGRRSYTKGELIQAVKVMQLLNKKLEELK